MIKPARFLCASCFFTQSDYFLQLLLCDELRDLVSFVLFEKRPWRSVTLSKVAG